MRAQITTDDRVTQFTDTARRFCEVIETRKRLTKRVFIHKCAELVAQVQAGSMHLISVRTRASGHKHPSTRFSHEDWWRLYKSLGKKLGKDDAYYLVFDPYKIDSDDPIQTLLSDDLADIYRDLREGLDLIDGDGPRGKSDAVWAWKFNFLLHTGHHCTSSLRAFQELVERYHEED